MSARFVGILLALLLAFAFAFGLGATFSAWMDER